MSPPTQGGLPLLALLFGAAAGWFVGEATAPGEPVPVVQTPPSAQEPSRPAVAGPESAPPAAAATTPRVPDPRPGAAPRVAAQGASGAGPGRVWLLDLTPAEHEARVMRSAAWMRAEAEAELASAPSAAAARAEDRLRAERAGRAALLAQLGPGRGPANLRSEETLPFELLADPALHAALRLDLRGLARQAVPVERTTTDLAPGTILLLEQGVYGGPKGSRFGAGTDTLVVRGAGRDRTLIVWQDWRVDRLSALVLQDLTVVVPERAGLEARSGMRCEATRCRFVLGTREPFLRASAGALLLFEDCLFEAGFGSGIGSGKLPFLDARRGMLARFRACEFTGPLPLFLQVAGHRDVCIVLDRVRGLGAFAGGLPLAGGGADWLLPIDTELPERPDPRPERPVARRYAELNPAWAVLDR